MKRTGHTAEQIIRKLKTAEQLIAQGKTLVEVCLVIEVTLAAAVRRDAGRQGPPTVPTGEGERPALAEGFSEGVAFTR